MLPAEWNSPNARVYFENVLFILAERVFVFTIFLIFNLALVYGRGNGNLSGTECSK